MFCIQCGLELGPDMQFCPRCGTKIGTTSSFSQNGIVLQEPASEITLPLLGRQVSFHASIGTYIQLRKRFQDLADEISEFFAQKFYSQYHSMDQFIQQFPKDVHDVFAHVIDKMNEMLSEEKVFGITQDELRQYTNQYCCCTYQRLQEIQMQYQQILDEQEGMREYREARKDSRGRVIGGGFGLGGAAKGMLTAGAINATTGVLHSLGNALGNLGSAMSASSAKNRLFHSGIAIDLARAIREDILGVHYVMLDLLAARTGQSIIRYTHEQEAQSNQILDDLEQQQITSSQEPEAVRQMLKTFPFNRVYYKM